jgi:hypothetical protein
MTQKSAVLISILSFYFFLGLSNIFPSATVIIYSFITVSCLLQVLPISLFLIWSHDKCLVRTHDESDSLRVRRSEDRIPGVQKFFRCSPDRSRKSPSFLSKGYRVFFFFFKAAGAWCWPSNSFYWWVANGLELYVLLPSVPAQACVGASLKFKHDEAPRHTFFSNRLSLPLSFVQIVSSRHSSQTHSDLRHGNALFNPLAPEFSFKF